MARQRSLIHPRLGNGFSLGRLLKEVKLAMRNYCVQFLRDCGLLQRGFGALRNSCGTFLRNGGTFRNGYGIFRDGRGAFLKDCGTFRNYRGIFLRGCGAIRNGCGLFLRGGGILPNGGGLLLPHSAAPLFPIQSPARRALQVSRTPRKSLQKRKYAHLLKVAKTAAIRLLIPLSIRAPDVELDSSKCI